MGRSQETFSKKEKEKKRQKKKQEKAEKMEERKANAKKGKSLDEMMAYLDEDGNLVSTPPDPARKKKEIKAEDIEIGIPRQDDIADDPIRKGVVDYFNDAKGFGFIHDDATGERVFVHVNQLAVRIQERDKVTFEVEKGPKGLNAVNVELVK